MAERKYALFSRPRAAKKGTKWDRLYPEYAFRKRNAITIYQDKLIANSLGLLDPDKEYRLMPVIQPKQLNYYVDRID